MKLSFTVLVLLLGMTAHANDSRLKRIISDPVLVAATDGISRKYDLKCKVPKSAEGIQWRCLNGPECGYTVNIACKKAESLVIRIDGFDDGKKNEISKLSFVFTVAVLAPTTPSPQTRLERLTTDKILTSVLTTVQKQMKVNCPLPTKDQDVDWQSSGMFNLALTCKSGDENALLTYEVSGRDDGTDIYFSKIQKTGEVKAY
jgi:hypothetical protein